MSSWSRIDMHPGLCAGLGALAELSSAAPARRWSAAVNSGMFVVHRALDARRSSRYLMALTKSIGRVISPSSTSCLNLRLMRNQPTGRAGIGWDLELLPEEFLSLLQLCGGFPGRSRW